jgi:hypothetical protein
MGCNFFLHSAFIFMGTSDETGMPEGLRIHAIFTETADRRRRSQMRYLRYLALLGILILPVAYSQAQVAVGVRVGPGYGYVAPVCAYGYYANYPYACAPYGYYGPRWFVGGVFIGAGPWYHGYYRPGYGYYGHVGYGYYGRGYYRPGAYAYSRGGGFGYAHSYARGPVGGSFHGGGRR